MSGGRRGGEGGKDRREKRGRQIPGSGGWKRSGEGDVTTGMEACSRAEERRPPPRRVMRARATPSCAAEQRRRGRRRAQQSKGGEGAAAAAAEQMAAAAMGHEGAAAARSGVEEARATPHAAEQRRLSPPPPVTRARAPPPRAREDGDGGGARVHMVSASAFPDAKNRRSDALTVRRTPCICLASEENLRAALNKMGVGGYVLEEVLDKVKNRHYQLACTLTFEATHGVSCDAGINHPNQYFSESQKVLQAKNQTVQSQSAT